MRKQGGVVGRLAIASLAACMAVYVAMPAAYIYADESEPVPAETELLASDDSLVAGEGTEELELTESPDIEKDADATSAQVAMTANDVAAAEEHPEWAEWGVVIKKPGDIPVVRIPVMDPTTGEPSIDKVTGEPLTAELHFYNEDLTAKLDFSNIPAGSRVCLAFTTKSTTPVPTYEYSLLVDGKPVGSKVGQVVLSLSILAFDDNGQQAPFDGFRHKVTFEYPLTGKTESVDLTYAKGVPVDVNLPEFDTELGMNQVTYRVDPDPAVDFGEFKGVQVADKQSSMDIPVYWPSWDNESWELADAGQCTASGILSGSNVSAGSEVSLVVSGVSAYGGVPAAWRGMHLSLIVDGKRVVDNFGTLNVSLPVPALDNGFGNFEYDGKLHQSWVDYPDGSTETGTFWAKDGERVSFSVSSMASGAEHVVFFGGLAHDEAQEVPVSGNTGIAASGSLAGENIPAGADVEVKATELKPGDPDYDKLTESMSGGLISGVYDISMLVNGAEIHDGFGDLTITMPVDPAYNGHTVTIWHLHDNGTITSQVTVVANGKVTFTVTDLSSFALEIGGLAEDEGDKPSTEKPNKDEGSEGEGNKDADVPEGELPQTGDPAAIFGVVAASGAVLASAGILSKKRR